MLFDLQSMFSDAQAITATAPSTNVIDLGAVDTPQHAAAAITRDFGKGRPVPVRIQVTEAFNNLTSLTVTLQSSDVEGFGSGVTDVASVVVPVANLGAGKVIPPFYIPEDVDDRYVRLNYTVTGTAPTTGKVTAGLVFGKHNWSA